MQRVTLYRFFCTECMTSYPQVKGYPLHEIMATRPITLESDTYYHVYNRGTNQMTIFREDADYRRFMLLLYLCNGTEKVNLSRTYRENDKEPLSVPELYKTDRGERLVNIGAYCIMSNHFHIFLNGCVKDGVSTFMQRVQTAYSMYFNKKYGRSGRLFQGTFRARHVDTDRYHDWLFAYIHLNPVKKIEPAWKEHGIVDVAGAKRYIEQYPYSSYIDYFVDGKRIESVILNADEFREEYRPDDFSTLAEDLRYYPQ